MHYLSSLIPDKINFDQRGFVGTILIDLLKAHYFIPHNLLTAKLECYGIDITGFSLILE